MLHAVGSSSKNSARLGMLAAVIGVNLCVAWPAQAATSPDLMGEITVETTRRGVEKKADQFIETFVPKTEASIARWREPVCPLVAGLPKAQGEYVLNRLSRNWQQAEVPLAGEQCDVNAFVIFTDEPELFLTKWQRKSGRIYGDAYPMMIKRFKEDSHPIKVWANKGHHGPGNGVSVSDDPNTGLGMAFQGARSTHQYTATRLQFPELTSFDSVIAVVDPKKLTGMPLSAVVDYLSIALAVEVRNDQQFSQTSTILNLMAEPQAGLVEWTAWDQAFLKSVYKADLSQTSQNSIIGSHLAIELLKPKE